MPVDTSIIGKNYGSKVIDPFEYMSKLSTQNYYSDANKKSLNELKDYNKAKEIMLQNTMWDGNINYTQAVLDLDAAGLHTQAEALHSSQIKQEREDFNKNLPKIKNLYKTTEDPDNKTTTDNTATTATPSSTQIVNTPQPNQPTYGNANPNLGPFNPLDNNHKNSYAPYNPLITPTTQPQQNPNDHSIPMKLIPGGGPSMDDVQTGGTPTTETNLDATRTTNPVTQESNVKVNPIDIEGDIGDLDTRKLLYNEYRNAPVGYDGSKDQQAMLGDLVREDHYAGLTKSQKANQKVIDDAYDAKFMPIYLNKLKEYADAHPDNPTGNITMRLQAAYDADPSGKFLDDQQKNIRAGLVTPETVAQNKEMDSIKRDANDVQRTKVNTDLAEKTSLDKELLGYVNTVKAYINSPDYNNLATKYSGSAFMDALQNVSIGDGKLANDAKFAMKQIVDKMPVSDFHRFNMDELTIESNKAGSNYGGTKAALNSAMDGYRNALNAKLKAVSGANPSGAKKIGLSQVANGDNFDVNQYLQDNGLHK